MDVDVEAVVVDFKTIDGKKFAVAKLKSGIITDPIINGSVIFLLGKKHWKGSIPAFAGMEVILEDLFRTVNGWQANIARPVQLKKVSKAANNAEDAEEENDAKGSGS